MKTILFFLTLTIIACKPAQSTTTVVNTTFNLLNTNCPENGKCTLELIPNKTIEFKKDEFGFYYPEISEGSKTILKYTFKKNPIPNTQDSNYTEIVYAELDSNLKEISLSNKELQNIKLFFGRLCYCKGETGYFPIKNGDFKLTIPSKNTVQIDLIFKVSEVPQIISEIHETISLK
jgi:hypothetical protein